MVEVGYQKKEEDTAGDPELVAALDVGVTVLAAVTSTKAGFQPLLVNGRPLKHLKQSSNTQRAHHQSHLARANSIGLRRSVLAASTPMCLRQAVGLSICS
jgi:putative transposase